MTEEDGGYGSAFSKVGVVAAAQLPGPGSHPGTQNRALEIRPKPPDHLRVLFDTVELRFGTRHDHILAHWCPPENHNFAQFAPPGPTLAGGYPPPPDHPSTPKPVQPSPAQLQGSGSHLDSLNRAFKIAPNAGH